MFKKIFFKNSILKIYFTFPSFRAMEDYKFLFKVVLIGNAGVGEFWQIFNWKKKCVSSELQQNRIKFTGKTCLVRRFTQGVFPPGQGATIGVDFMIKTVVVDNEKIKVSYTKNNN